MCSTFHTSECVSVPHFRMHSALQNVLVFHTLECILHFRMCSAFQASECILHFRMCSAFHTQPELGQSFIHSVRPQTALWLGKHSNRLAQQQIALRKTPSWGCTMPTSQTWWVFLCTGNGERCVCINNIYIYVCVTHSTESFSSSFSQQTSTKICVKQSNSENNDGLFTQLNAIKLKKI